MSSSAEPVKTAAEQIAEAMVDAIEYGREHPNATREEMRAQLLQELPNILQPMVDKMDAAVNRGIDTILEIIAEKLQKVDVISGAKAAAFVREMKETK